MLLFLLMLAVPIKMSYCQISGNLTEITWRHAVNSQKGLKDALKSQLKIKSSKFKKYIYM